MNWVKTTLKICILTQSLPRKVRQGKAIAILQSCDRIRQVYFLVNKYKIHQLIITRTIKQRMRFTSSPPLHNVARIELNRKHC